MKKILIDSGPIIALFNKDDKYHLASVAFIKKNKHELVTTLATITEVTHLLDFSRVAQSNFLEWLRLGAVNIVNITIHDIERIKSLMDKYSDLPMDFADACLVYLGEKLDIDEVATIDRDFDIYRKSNKRPFTKLIS
ncbi:MAG: pilus assembly protein [Gammaproteobacteria bacterium]|nr:MAG: pilus assembly protein [Gammaproteobacteria bacterium]